MELGNLIYRKKDGDHGDLKISLQISSEKKKITTNGDTGKKKKKLHIYCKVHNRKCYYFGFRNNKKIQLLWNDGLINK